jgi:choline dehydrogenase
MKTPFHFNNGISPEKLLFEGRISRRTFFKMMSAAGVSAATASVYANASTVIAQTQFRNTENLKDSYDYVICGAGSSGCVVASELARKNPAASILLVEAGGRDDKAGILSLLWGNIYKDPDLFWNFHGEPEPFLNGRTPDLPMGRVVGGGSSVNALIYARGHKADYDGWAEQLGDKKWSYESVLAIYRQMENYDGPASAFRGKGGLLHSQLQRDAVPLASDLRLAGEAMGIPNVEDINAETMERDSGIGPSNIIAKDGMRMSIARAYLYPVLADKNITVLTEAIVQKLHIEGTKAKGINLLWRGKVKRISATGRVVLCTGALKTPQILMLSGIGNATELAKLGIKSVVDLPGVGENFHDHPLVASCAWESPYDFKPHGNGSECVYFSNVNSKPGAPDMMPVQMQIPFVADSYAKREGVPSANLWVIVPGLAKPRSRGKVSIGSNDILHNPVVHTRFLSDPHDIATLRLGVEQAREMGNSSQMRKHVKREVLPGPLKGDDMTDFIRNTCGTYYHMCGTAKMGIAGDKMGVVDSNLAVRGIENLSIADTSVFPDIPRGNTMVPAAMVGFQMARILST